jgi:hypothetical protein
MIPILLTVLLAVTLPGRAAAQAGHHSPHANLQNREIKALSAFAGKATTPERLASLTSEIGTLQGQLRAIHLQAHLEVSAPLTPEQRSRYNDLHGYHGR